ncbi:MAG: hypothetical protein IH571_06215 [Acholeplasmataceae bacterium]|nr:hypothetical protein [Acholeplasmataceae bacterium]
MKLKDFIWIGIISAITAIIIVPFTRGHFETATSNSPYLMGFIKTAVLATMGELLVNRIHQGIYFSGKGVALKFIVWGFLGVMFVLVFKVFAEGVSAAQQQGLLPQIIGNSLGASLLTAFLISLVMNLCFAPAFMILHRITDGFIELGEGSLRKLSKVRFSLVINRIDWSFFFGFVILKTIPIFWIPAHTITFLLPENYRVLMAAYLSIALGIILTLTKKNSKNQNTE